MFTILADLLACQMLMLVSYIPVLWSAYFSLRGCVKFAPAAIRSQEVGFTQPLREKFASLSTSWTQIESKFGLRLQPSLQIRIPCKSLVPWDGRRYWRARTKGTRSCAGVWCRRSTTRVWFGAATCSTLKMAPSSGRRSMISLGRSLIRVYRVFHQLVDLGWVDLYLRCYIILPRCSADSAKIPSALAELGWQRNC